MTHTKINGHHRPLPGKTLAADTPAASHVTDHPFTPKRQWWTTCRDCGLAEAAHRDTTVPRAEAA